MTLRTPRRRISPRTIRRCRVIRNFFRRALGSSSQPEIKISSSIAVNVTDLKHKIVGLEHQLNEVSQHCRDFACLETLSKNSNSSVPVALNQTAQSIDRNPEAPFQRQSKEEGTKILYKTSESHYKQSEDSDYGAKGRNGSDSSQANVMNKFCCDTHAPKTQKKKSKLYSQLKDYDQDLPNRRTKSVNENFGSFYSTSSYHSFIDPKMSHVHKGDCNERQNRNTRREYIEIEPFHPKDKTRDHVKNTNKDEKRVRSRKIKHNRELDQEFIADIIRRQYKPVKMFGRKESDLSQFSAPVCRDQEYLIPEDVQNSELCSCCYESRRSKSKRHKDLNDMRSICDTRLYSSKKQPRSRPHRRLVEVYNDSDLYDLVPVKEKSSPKSRRKFAEDNMIYNYYKEVPPSPRTHRPRLNLKSQYFAEFEDFLAQKRQNRRNSPSRPKRNQERGEFFETDISENPTNHNQKQRLPNPNQTHVQSQNTGTASSLPTPKFGNEVTAETILNKTQETDSSIDKTDKALSEIKDILQSFLLEIKKETTASQCDKSELTSKVTENGLINNHKTTSVKNSVLPLSGHSFNYNTPCNMSPCMPAFPNPCCYPILPMCPMNCMQNGYVVPSPSYTCATCANKEATNEGKPSKSANNTTTEFCNPATEELIKEIYKYVAQSPRMKRNDQDTERRQKENKLLTSRSVGGSTKGSKKDANVGTPKMKCYSKSCEAISTRLISDTYYSGTNASYSDTVLEKLSVEATPSETISETDFTTESTSIEKGKKTKLSKVLRSFGLMKKKKRDVIEELSESETAVDVEITPKKPPFKQKITNYMMHGQEYFHPPPVPPMHVYHQPPEYREQQPYLPRVSEYPAHPAHEASYPHRSHPHDRNPNPYHTPPMPSAPPYSQGFDNYKHMQQNVPLCLKEIEVKSIGTQSERKMSFFSKMKTRIQPTGFSVRSEEISSLKNCSTQTAQNKPTLFNWKNIEKQPNKMDPLSFSYMKQKQLAEGDMKLRNAMMKKLFYKRNPFSPRNLLVRTILGKDKSSYGEPPAMYRPRMFF